MHTGGGEHVLEVVAIHQSLVGRVRVERGVHLGLGRVDGGPERVHLGLADVAEVRGLGGELGGFGGERRFEVGAGRLDLPIKLGLVAGERRCGRV